LAESSSVARNFSECGVLRDVEGLQRRQMHDKDRPVQNRNLWGWAGYALYARDVKLTYLRESGAGICFLIRKIGRLPSIRCFVASWLQRQHLKEKCRRRVGGALLPTLLIGLRF
jgi:hypothetical protein